ncbi:MAG TPA: rhodanese-like domain-containing protein, partial [Candidatus Solibacter sp.]|nr:rhodanese-like domain-containing protein [Candidatus Solibacter sp.]
AHIPGAQFLPGDELSTPMQDGQLMLELPPVDQLQKAFWSHGITNNSRIVLYMTRGTISPATRAYLTFDAVGLGAQTSILDAGFSVWKGEGRAVTDQVKAPNPGKLDLCLRDDVIASADYVHSNVRRQGVAIVDARLARFYAGEAAGRNHDGSSQRAGHIPGAVSLPYDSLFTDKSLLLSADELRAKFTAAGVKSGDRVVSYCHIGQQATVVYFTARYLGYDARLFDGSFEDWNAHADWPVEK